MVKNDVQKIRNQQAFSENDVFDAENAVNLHIENPTQVKKEHRAGVLRAIFDHASRRRKALDVNNHPGQCGSSSTGQARGYTDGDTGLFGQRVKN